MIVYYITKKEQAALDGMGGLFGSGRWHKKGNRVIYTSGHASLAAWEKLVHVASFENLPDDLLLIKIEIPDLTEIRTVPEKILVSGWNDYSFSGETIDYETVFLRIFILYNSFSHGFNF